eukprot:938747-Amphidinium_carterae.1
MSQPVFDSSTARGVSERPPQQDSYTWGAKWQYITTGLLSQPNPPNCSWSGRGLGWPAPCRPRWKRY